MEFNESQYCDCGACEICAYLYDDASMLNNEDDEYDMYDEYADYPEMDDSDNYDIDVDEDHCYFE